MFWRFIESLTSIVTLLLKYCRKIHQKAEKSLQDLEIAQKSLRDFKNAQSPWRTVSPHILLSTTMVIIVKNLVPVHIPKHVS